MICGPDLDIRLRWHTLLSHSTGATQLGRGQAGSADMLQNMHDAWQVPQGTLVFL